jgi:hypothetical protein
VRDGRLHAGTALPSTRALAAELGIARGRGGGGLRAARRPRASSSRGAGRPRAWRRWRRLSARRRPRRRAHCLRALRPASGVGRASAFPRGPWLAAMRRALAAAPDADLGYGSWAGAPALRAVLARYLVARAAWSPPPGHRRHHRHHPGDRAAGRAPARPRRAPRARRGARASGSTARSCSAPGSSWSSSTWTRADCGPTPCPRRPPRWSPPRTSSHRRRSSPPSAARRCSTGRPLTTPS